MKKRVADIIVETLYELGIKKNFCVVGGGAMHLNNAFDINEKIETIYCHHEQACAFAAEGYAKFTGNVAVVTVTSGPGAANTINGVYSAWVDSAPMIVIAGHPRSDTTVKACGLDLRCRGVQELDAISMVKGITKYAICLEEPLEVKSVIHKAFNIAMSGRKGPVWISVPLDVQATLIDEDLCKCENNDSESEYELKYTKLFDEIVSLLKEAKRPCILTGTGIRHANAMDDFHELTKKLKIPIVGGALLADTLPENYPLYYGTSGNIGPRTGNFILQNSDCILVFGNSMSNRQTGFNLDGFAPEAKIIMVDVAPDEMKKPGLKIYLPIVADLSSFIPNFLNYLIEEIVADKKWIEYCNCVKALFEHYDDAKYSPEGRIPAKYFWKVFREKIPEDTVLALGNSNGVVSIYQYGVKSINQRVITNYNAGSMGYDLPEAIGISVATNRPTICVTGDGSIMMNLQELETITYNKLNIKVVIFSNDGYGAIRQTCKNYFDGRYTGCDSTSGVGFPDFADIAKTFGFRYISCACCEELEIKIDEFLNESDNTLLCISQLHDDPLYPKIMSKLKKDGTFETPSFIDMFPYLSIDEENYLKELERNLKNV